MNRFTQTPQPFIVNPISVEDLSRVPMAKAAATGAGIRASNSLNIDYTVDPKDAEEMANRVKPIEDGKNTIVERIMKEGVNNQLIGEFIELKKGYDQTKIQIKSAEENRVRVDKWRDQIFQLHGHDAAYMDFIKAKEYTLGWNGTFAKTPEGETKITTFDGAIAPKSFSIADDFTEAFREVDPTMIGAIADGRVEFKKIKGEDGVEHLVFKETGNSKKFSNEVLLNDKLEALMLEYLDPNTARGAYFKYREFDEVDIRAIAQGVAASELKTYTEGGTVNHQYIKPSEKTEAPAPTPPTPWSHAIINATAVPTGVDLGATYDRFNLAGTTKFKLKAQSLFSRLAIGSSMLGPIFSTSKLDMEDRREELQEKLDPLVKNAKDIAEKVNIQLELDAEQLDKDIRDFANQATKTHELSLQNGTIKPGQDLAYEALLQDLAKYPKAYSKDPEDALTEYSKRIAEYYQTIPEYKSTVPLYADRASSLYDLGEPSWSERDYMDDIVKNIRPGFKSVKVINSGERREVLDGKELLELQAIIHNSYTGSESDIKASTGEAGFRIDYMGNLTTNPSLVRVSSGHTGHSVIPEGMFSGAVFLKYPVDSDGNPVYGSRKEEMGVKYVIGAPPNRVESDPEFRRLDEKFRVIGRLPAGESIPIRMTLPTPSGDSVVTEYLWLKTLEFPTDVLIPAEDGSTSLGRYNPGQKVLIRDERFMPVGYQEYMFSTIDLIK